MLHLKLEQNFGGARTIGRLRVSALTGGIGASALPVEVADALKLPAAQRTAAQAKALSDFHLKSLPEHVRLDTERARLEAEAAAKNWLTKALAGQTDRAAVADLLLQAWWLLTENKSFTVNSGQPRFYSALEGVFPTNYLRHKYFLRGDWQMSQSQNVFVRYGKDWEHIDCEGCGGTNAAFNQSYVESPRDTTVVGHTWVVSNRALNELPTGGLWRERLDEAIQCDPRDLTPNGWVVRALQAAWRSVYEADPHSPFVDGVRYAVALGDDTDTIAAIAGEFNYHITKYFLFASHNRKRICNKFTKGKLNSPCLYDVFHGNPLFIAIHKNTL